MNTYQPEYAASTYPLTDITTLAAHWQELESKAENPFFLSWQWMVAWLRCFRCPVQIIEVWYKEQQLVGLGLLVFKNTRRHGFLVSKCMHLHQTGNAASDQIWVEYNGFLTDREHSLAAELAALSLIREQLQWDEWIVGAIEASKIVRFADTLQTSSHILWEAPCYGVNLRQLRESGHFYMSSLSANTRYQINRSIKMYQHRGEVKLVRPQSVNEALVWFKDIAPLHLKRWGDGINQSGFANPDFVNFHQQIIQENWQQSVDLVRVNVGDTVIATLYNFIYRNRVYFYLAGLKVEDDNKLKPGLVGHAMCIQDYMLNGYDFYDFMGGDEQYKSQLGLRHNHLVQVTLQRRQFKFLLEQHLRKVKQQFTVKREQNNSNVVTGKAIPKDDL